MPSQELTLTPNIYAEVDPGIPVDRIVVTIIGGVPAEVWATCDGTTPSNPIGAGTVNNAQIGLPAAIGARDVLRPQWQQAGAAPAIGPPGRFIPIIRLLSPGAPNVRLSW